MGQVLFFSDLHLAHQKDPLYFSLFQTIEKELHPGDALVFNGDLFDFLMGSKKSYQTEYQDLLHLLRKKTSQGVFFYVLDGNHDFQMKTFFHSVPGTMVGEDEIYLEYLGKKFLITHGDLANPSDHAYLFWRSFLRKPISQKLISWIPDPIMAWTGKTLSQASKNNRKRKDLKKVEASVKEAKESLRVYAEKSVEQYDFDYMIMGHTHEEDHFSFQSGDKKRLYLNMGFPRKSGTYLKWDSKTKSFSRPKLESYEPEKNIHPQLYSYQK